QRAVELARADQQEAEAQADLRRRALTRRQTLLERGVGTEAGIEEAELALASARAVIIARAQAEAQAEARAGQAQTALARQRISVAEAERRLAETELRAGFDGVLDDVSVVEGGNVGVNERLMRVVDPQALEVSFRLSTAQYLRLIYADGALPPLPGEAALDIGGVEIVTPVTLVRASATVGEGQSGRLVFAEIAAPRGFRPGDFVTLRVAEPALPDVALLPASAVDARGGVLLLGSDDRLEEGQVSILRRQGDQVLVRAPVELAGREVVAARGPLLGAGIRVRPQRDELAAMPEMPDMVTLQPEHRARLIAQVQASATMPDAARSRILAQLQADVVPARLIERLEGGGDSAGAGVRGGQSGRGAMPAGLPGGGG
ncbi:MAG: HlyD family efflux transporter periplasmic adaptor subunit, partial [Pararhodobacter sp.]|nr:HlyD family efflux transporter periplasmic adaptor subunit [Pararhodobacter sp.]